MLHVAADVKTADDLDLPVPALKQRDDGQRAPETVTVEPSDELLDYVRDLGDRAAKVRNRAVGPDEDNMLKISGDGRRAALDLRLRRPAADDPGQDRRGRRPDRRDLDGSTGTTSTSPPAASRTRCAGRCSWCSATWAPPAPAGTSTTSSATSSSPAACPARRSGSSTRPRPTGTRPSCSPPAAPARSRS